MQDNKNSNTKQVMGKQHKMHLPSQSLQRLARGSPSGPVLTGISKPGVSYGGCCTVLPFNPIRRTAMHYFHWIGTRPLRTSMFLLRWGPFQRWRVRGRWWPAPNTFWLLTESRRRGHRLRRRGVGVVDRDRTDGEMVGRGRPKTTPGIGRGLWSRRCRIEFYWYVIALFYFI